MARIQEGMGNILAGLRILRESGVSPTNTIVSICRKVPPVRELPTDAEDVLKTYLMALESAEWSLDESNDFDDHVYAGAEVDTLSTELSHFKIREETGTSTETLQKNSALHDSRYSVYPGNNISSSQSAASASTAPSLWEPTSPGVSEAASPPIKHLSYGAHDIESSKVVGAGPPASSRKVTVAIDSDDEVDDSRRAQIVQTTYPSSPRHASSPSLSMDQSRGCRPPTLPQKAPGTSGRLQRFTETQGMPSAQEFVEDSDTDKEEDEQQDASSLEAGPVAQQACGGRGETATPPPTVEVAAVSLGEGEDEDEEEDMIMVLPRSVMKPKGRGLGGNVAKLGAPRRMCVDSSSEDDEEEEEEESEERSPPRREVRARDALYWKANKSVVVVDSASEEKEDESVGFLTPVTNKPPRRNKSQVHRAAGWMGTSVLATPNATPVTGGRVGGGGGIENSPPPPPRSAPPKNISRASLIPGLIGLTTNSMTPAAFKKQRVDLSAKLFREYNRRIFQGKLPHDLSITWNAHLKTTAGITKYKMVRVAGADVYTASVELSTKVLDSYNKLASTLCHELCHAAAWLIDHNAKPPHGAVFKKWGNAAMKEFPGLSVSTCHNYAIHCPYKYKCTNTRCNKEYSRHSKSIDTESKCCGLCKGKLIFVGKFNADGTEVAKREASGFSLFVKEQYGNTKLSMGPNTPHKDIMKGISERWKNLSLNDR